MNVYTVIEDGEERCWKALTADLAMRAAKAEYMKEYLAEDASAEEVAETEQQWEREIFGGCLFVGELMNP